MEEYEDVEEQKSSSSYDPNDNYTDDPIELVEQDLTQLPLYHGYPQKDQPPREPDIPARNASTLKLFGGAILLILLSFLAGTQASYSFRHSPGFDLSGTATNILGHGLPSETNIVSLNRNTRARVSAAGFKVVGVIFCKSYPIFGHASMCHAE